MKLLTAEIPLFQAIALRGTVSTLVMLVIARAARAPLILRGQDAKCVGLRSIAEVGATITFITALTHMPLANMSAIMQAMPLLVTLVAALMFGEQLGVRRLTAITIGFFGVLLIVRPGSDGFDRWALLALLSVVLVVVRDLTTRRVSLHVPTVTVAVWAGFSVTLMGLLGTFWTGLQPLSAGEVWLTLSAAGNLIIGYITVVMATRVGHVGFVAPFRYTSLLWAIIIGWLVFDTLPDELTLTGAAIVVATGLFTLVRERQLRRAT